jgi:hypothetical protein
MLMSDALGLVQLDEHGLIDEDIACVRCDYNLRTQTVDGSCPECGMAVHDTLRLAWLRGRDATWLRRIASGALWAMIAVASFVVVEVWMAVELFGIRRTGDPPVVLAVFIAGLAVGWWAFWLLTSPDAEHDGEVSRSIVRRAARVAMSVGFGGVIVAFLVSRMWNYEPMPLLAVSLMVLAFGSLAMLIYAARLARRVPDRRLSMQCRIVAVGYVVGLVGMSGLIAVVESSGGAINVPLEQLAGISSLLLLVCSVWSLPLLWWYRKRFLEAAKLAQQREGA